MGGYCSGHQTYGEPELGYRYPAQTLGGKAYSAQQIWIVVRLQSAFRMWLAQRKVQRLRHELFAPGMHCPRYGENYQSMNV